MKLLIVVGLLMSAALSSAQTTERPRGCISFLGQCIRECPVGTHSYTLGCGHKTPEATCLNPNPIAEEAILCDYSACYCNEPTIRDQKTGECVLPENCSPQDPEPCVEQESQPEQKDE